MTVVDDLTHGGYYTIVPRWHLAVVTLGVLAFGILGPDAVSAFSMMGVGVAGAQWAKTRIRRGRS